MDLSPDNLALVERHAVQPDMAKRGLLRDAEELNRLLDVVRREVLAATGAAAEIRGGKLEISIDVDALPAIVNGSCCCDALQGLWKVTDAEAFAKEVCRALNDEDEQGTTRVHKMFDGAFLEAVEQGAEGIEECSEEEFEEISARFQAKPLDDPGRPVPPHGSGP